MTLRQWLQVLDEINRHMLPLDVRQVIDAHRPIEAMLNSTGWGIGGGKPEPPSSPPSQPGAQIREQRKRLGWSQRYLAKRAGCAPHTLIDLELQRKIPAAHILKAIFDALHKA